MGVIRDDGLPVISMSMQALGIANLLYWYANLLFFLVPVGVVRYLQAHYFCVEAVEVTIWEGVESFCWPLSLRVPCGGERLLSSESKPCNTNAIELTS
jgi:hypothetical protein